MVAFANDAYLASFNTTPLLFLINNAWQWFIPNLPGYGAGVNQNLSGASPMTDSSTGAMLQTEFDGWALDQNDNTWKYFGENGFLGNITQADDGNTYMYYCDYSYSDNHAHLFRRQVMPWLTQMGPRVPVADLGPYMQGLTHIPQVNYHRDLHTYVVAYSCDVGNGTADICVRTFPNMNLPGFDHSTGNFTEASTYGIGIQNDWTLPNQGVSGGVRFSQFGIRKTPQGQHFSDQDGQVIIYFQAARYASPLDWIWGDYYEKRVYITHDYF
jgi:hypothetical protein